MVNITTNVKKILSFYESDNPGTKEKIARFLLTGKLGGTGKIVILPVDQGFEHGPDRSFAMNQFAYDPHYHVQLAIDAGLNGYASVLGMLEASADTFAGRIPLILKVNSNNSLMSDRENTNQAITASVQDALRLGCSAIGFTIYPASDNSFGMFEEISQMIEEAKSYGLATVIWSYPRGGDLPKEYETSIDVISYAAHIACLLGAHIVKVKLPKNTIYDKKVVELYQKNNIDISTLAKRVALVKQACFAGKRIVIFSGGEAKNQAELLQEIRDIAIGGGNGSIIGRNTFQRKREDALSLLSDVIKVYRGKNV